MYSNTTESDASHELTHADIGNCIVLSILNHHKRFMEDKKYSDVRDKFFSGELHASIPKPTPSHSIYQNPLETLNPSPVDLFHRVDGRLRRVVVKACENSAPACKIVESFEDFLIRTFTNVDNVSVSTTSTDIHTTFWQDVLLEKPSVSQTSDGATNITFLFDGDSSAGGFHRILVHAVSHFHCLKAKTSSLDNARVLSVTGTMRGSNHRMLDYLASLQEQRQRQRSS